MARLKIGALGSNKSRKKVSKIVAPAEKEERETYDYEGMPIDFHSLDNLGEYLKLTEIIKHELLDFSKITLVIKEMHAL